MLRDLRVAELRYRAVLEVLDGATVTEVARRFGVSRQSVHVWLRRYAADGGAVNLEDRSSRPHACPHQMQAVVEVRVLEVRDAHPAWGANRIRYQLERDGVVPVPGRSGIYRALVRHGRIDPEKRKRRRADYRRWERGRPGSSRRSEQHPRPAWVADVATRSSDEGVGVRATRNPSLRSSFTQSMLNSCPYP